ncbi:unnamed protein product, partial [Musa textilis]
QRQSEELQPAHSLEKCWELGVAEFDPKGYVNQHIALSVCAMPGGELLRPYGIIHSIQTWSDNKIRPRQQCGQHGCVWAEQPTPSTTCPTFHTTCRCCWATAAGTSCRT